jgi:glycerophosphoryl diester phosphodiesterase
VPAGSRWAAAQGGGFYHSTVKSAIDRDGDTLTVLDVLAKQVGVRKGLP